LGEGDSLDPANTAATIQWQANKKTMDQSQLKWIATFIWNIADDRLRDVYVRGKYRDVILPFNVLRRLDAVLESTKDAVLERKRFLDQHRVLDQEGALRMAAGQAFYNTSEFTLSRLTASGQGQRLRDNFIAYLDGFSPNVQDILHKFAFRNQIQKMVDAPCRRISSPPASSTSCSPIRPTAKAGRPTWSAWAARPNLATHASSSAMAATRSSSSSPVPAMGS
jgi:hypothetical protein